MINDMSVLSAHATDFFINSDLRQNASVVTLIYSVGKHKTVRAVGTLLENFIIYNLEVL